FFSSRRRHTRSKRDWSSDVCSSDLVVTRKGHIDPGARLFNTGDAGAVVYTGGSGVDIARKGLEGRPTNDPPAEVADAGDPLEVAAILTDLNERGVQRLLVEGGGHIHTMFLTSGLVDELRLAVAPLFIRYR